jgi:hypothetical protein
LSEQAFFDSLKVVTDGIFGAVKQLPDSARDHAFLVLLNSYIESEIDWSRLVEDEEVVAE